MPVSLEDFPQHRLMGGQLAIIDEVRMKTNSQIKAYHELDQIERDTVESLFLPPTATCSLIWDDTALQRVMK